MTIISFFKNNFELAIFHNTGGDYSYLNVSQLFLPREAGTGASLPWFTPGSISY